MLPTILLGIVSLSNFGAVNNAFNDFYTKTETVQVTKTPKRTFNFQLTGDEVTKIVNLDREYPVLQTLNFNLSSDKGMWVKANLPSEFPKLNNISVKSSKVDFTTKATGKMPNVTTLDFVTRNGDTFVDWQATGDKPIDFNLNTRSGDTGLILSQQIKAVNLSSRSGEMYVKWHVDMPSSSLKMNSSSGDLHIELEKGLKSASIQTKSGDVDMQLDPQWETNAEINIVTKTGDILLEIPKGVNVVLNAKTTTGEIEPGNLKETRVDNKTKMFTQQASAKSPTITLNIETRTGDVLLH